MTMCIYGIIAFSGYEIYKPWQIQNNKKIY